MICAQFCSLAFIAKLPWQLRWWKRQLPQPVSEHSPFFSPFFSLLLVFVIIIIIIIISLLFQFIIIIILFTFGLYKAFITKTRWNVKIIKVIIQNQWVMSQDFRVSLSILFWQNKSHLLMLGKMCPSRITESCIKVRKSITTDYFTGVTRFIGSRGRFRFRQEWTKKQSFKPRANGSNSIGQQLPTLLDVTCCVRLHTLLHVVACCWELLRKVWNRSNF